jgi:heme A synthase
MTTTGLAIAVYNVAVQNTRHFSRYRHDTIGLVVFLLVFVQVMSGWFRPHLPKKPAKRSDPFGANDAEEEGNVATATANEQPVLKKSLFRVLFEYQHRILGLGLLGLAWYEVYLGIGLFQGRYGLNYNATAVFFGVAASLAGLIVIGKIGLVGMSKR